jgi:DNA-directed RNA polymerase specialized sigma24 family protein
MDTTADRRSVGAVHDAVTARREQLLAFVRQRAGARVDAEEIVQHAIQRALERAEQVRDPARAEAWLGRVVRNVLFDELRKKPEPFFPAGELELAAIPDAGSDCWCVLVQADQLKPEYAEILRRVVIDGVPVSRVAVELGLTANNAMVRLHRARVALKERLAAHCGTTTARACADCGCEEDGVGALGEPDSYSGR